MTKFTETEEKQMAKSKKMADKIVAKARANREKGKTETGSKPDKITEATLGGEKYKGKENPNNSKKDNESLKYSEMVHRSHATQKLRKAIKQSIKAEKKSKVLKSLSDREKTPNKVKSLKRAVRNHTKNDSKFRHKSNRHLQAANASWAMRSIRANA